MKFLKTINGYKFYLGTAAAFVLWLGWVFGWWTFEEVEKLVALNGIFLGFAWRSAIKKLEV